MPTAPVPVEFIAGAANDLPPDVQERLTPELRTVIDAITPDDRTLKAITVSRCFAGYIPRPDVKVVLGVEVRYDDGHDTHIVKLGTHEKVSRDYQGWLTCTRGRSVSSRIFAPVRRIELPGDRAAVVYRDAYTLFGLDRESSQPLPLEEVARRAVLSEDVDLMSVERAIAQIYTDLGLWFYHGAGTDRRRAAAFYHRELGTQRHDEPAKQVVRCWLDSPDRQELRRDAVWALAGRDRPSADPVAEPAQYLDPVELVTWMLADDSGARLPDTLVGRSHGDLHARNVLLGIRRGEAEYPAVFDYGEMSADNVLAWDFAKLEMELRVRLLPGLLHEDAVRKHLLAASGFQSREASTAPTPPAERAERFRAFLGFEKLLEREMARLLSRQQVEPIRPFVQPPTGIAHLDRLLAILMRVRKEAALWLGFSRYARKELWRDEYYFALAVYGLMNARWDYEAPEAECALVTAGFAAARMPSVPRLLVKQIDAWKDDSTEFPSYRVPLAVVHRHWTARDYQTACRIAERLVLLVKADGPAGQLRRLRVRDDMRHAIPLVAEAALVEMEAGYFRDAEPLLDGLRPLARAFEDYETLGRIGRLFKDSGDKRWEESGLPFERFRDSPGWHMYRQALDVYREAFEATDDYYPGINAATLAALTHDPQQSRELAQRVTNICTAMMRNLPRSERYWVFATRGEAAVLLDRSDDAVTFYRTALAELTPGQSGWADSAYKQLCRLWNALGEDSVGPSLRLFETSEFAPSLSTGYLGRKRHGT